MSPFLFRVLDLYRVPLALWYPKLPASIELSNCLRYAKIGSPPECWSDMTLEGKSLPAWHSWAFSVIVGMSRLCAFPLPWPRVAPLKDPGIVIDWIVNTVQLLCAALGQCADYQGPARGPAHDTFRQNPRCDERPGVRHCLRPGRFSRSTIMHGLVYHVPWSS
jgi:hypothetical protein